jgi:hypothetical protein
MYLDVKVGLSNKFWARHLVDTVAIWLKCNSTPFREDGRQPFPYGIIGGLPVIRSRSANTIQRSFTNAVHIRVPRSFSELAVFDARLYIRVRRIDEPA